MKRPFPALTALMIIAYIVWGVSASAGEVYLYNAKDRKLKFGCIKTWNENHGCHDYACYNADGVPEDFDVGKEWKETADVEKVCFKTTSGNIVFYYEFRGGYYHYAPTRGHDENESPDPSWEKMKGTDIRCIQNSPTDGIPRGFEIQLETSADAGDPPVDIKDNAE